MVDEETIQYCKENKIGVEAWSPLGSGACLNNPKIQEIANKYQKSSAQIILRWLLQKGIVILPKSVHENRIKENIDIFDFELNEEEMKQISSLDMGYSGSRAKHFEPDFVRMVLNNKIHD